MAQLRSLNPHSALAAAKTIKTVCGYLYCQVLASANCMKSGDLQLKDAITGRCSLTMHFRYSTTTQLANQSTRIWHAIY